MREVIIHIAIRTYLKKNGWTLVAGEFPGGTDDELYVLSITNPEVARDNSPDPRRHSVGEIIPDLLAYKDGEMLIIEAKPKYSIQDKEKLLDLLINKKKLLINSLGKFCTNNCLLGAVDISRLNFVPTLAFGYDITKIHKEDKGFAHIYVEDLNNAVLIKF